MIQVNEVRRDGGWELVFSGHAGYSQGEDIVCAAVSILFFTLAEAVSRGGGGASFRSGQGRVFVPDGYERERSFVRRGVLLLAERYPGNVKWG